jgi:hypothetical protein
LDEPLNTLVQDSTLRLDQGARAVELVSMEFDAQRNARRLLTLLKQQVGTARLESKVA